MTDAASRSYIQRDGKTLTIDAKGRVKRLLPSGARSCIASYKILVSASGCIGGRPSPCEHWPSARLQSPLWPAFPESRVFFMF